MNTSFVYKGMLIKFNDLIGWFFYDFRGNRFDFYDKDICKKFIDCYY